MWILLIELLLSLHISIADDPSMLECAFSEHGIEQKLEEGANLISDDGNVIKCHETFLNCFTVWLEEVVNGSVITTVHGQGCWKGSKQDCSQHSCVGRKKSKAFNNSIFCCCQGNLCNSNFSYQYDPNFEVQEPLRMADVHSRMYGNSLQPIIIIICAIFSFLIILAIIFGMYRYWLQKQKPLPDSLKLVESSNHITPTIDLSNLGLQEIIGQGRYGNVWRGTLRDEVVAVKVFPAHYKQYFVNERDIYTLHFMEHPHILKYYGSEQRFNKDMNPEYLLVLSYMPLGNLQSFLKEWTLSWADCIRMMSGIAKGLAHLHGDICKGDKYKPCISHRDLSSRNVLVTVDRSCVICDLGFALKIAGSSYFINGEEQHAETRSLTDVGTLRYMAPEVLEGAVNLRDCESSLKEIDIYALGLVMWEIATRCYDLYQGSEIPCYKMPFEAEIGSHPTFETMQILVARHKARPLFPEVWKNYNPGIKLLKETIEECWDQDAEARLTAMCVVERLKELPLLWDRYKGSILPKIVPAAIPEPIDYSLCDKLSAINSTSQSENTVDTYLSLENTPIITTPGKNELLAHIQVPLPSLQPHHGHNPSLERNTIQESSEESNIYYGQPIKQMNTLSSENTALDSLESAALLPPSPLSPVQFCQINPFPAKILNEDDKRNTWFERGVKKIKSYKTKFEAIGRSSKPGKADAENGHSNAQTVVVSLNNGETKTTLKRPTSLFVSPNNLKPCKERLSTPYGTTSSRFSLCDDSIMLGYDPNSSCSELSESHSVPDCIPTYLGTSTSGISC